MKSPRLQRRGWNSPAASEPPSEAAAPNWLTNEKLEGLMLSCCEDRRSVWRTGCRIQIHRWTGHFLCSRLSHSISFFYKSWHFTGRVGLIDDLWGAKRGTQLCRHLGTTLWKTFHQWDKNYHWKSVNVQLLSPITALMITDYSVPLRIQPTKSNLVTKSENMFVKTVFLSVRLWSLGC